VWALIATRRITEAQAEHRDMVDKAAGEALDDWAELVLRK
jgi:hypothetical protein